MIHAARTSGPEWARQQVEGLPMTWAGRLLRDWTRSSQSGGDWVEQMQAEAGANRRLLRITAALESCRVPLDSSDGEICDLAERIAVEAFDAAGRPHDMREIRAGVAEVLAHRQPTEAAIDAAAGQMADQIQAMHQPEAVRRRMAALMRAWRIEPPVEQIQHGPAIARMTDAIWIRRKLRAVHARTVEKAAIDLGLVNRARQPYVSTETLNRRAQQIERARAMLESTIARNEDGQEFTLAELASKGPANKAIRRAELMTRIAGFERIARDMGHDGVFLTMTCPSRMHKWSTKRQGGGVIENPRFDGTTPRDAQRYLARVWARIRAKLNRDGIGVYGFRIAEPNHDGTPHWHLLLFVEPARNAELEAVIRRYALADSPGERGAAQHRVDWKAIDWTRGSAAGYIAKYVAKNIDGYKLDKDLIGNDALETSQRVEAWAATWGIRQFQQIGGAPVGVWRELRRVEDMPAAAPDFVREAHAAVNRIADTEAGEVKSVAWDRYTAAQGGVFCGRKHRIRLAKQQRAGLNRYGEARALTPYGVKTETREFWTPPWMAHMRNAHRAATRVIEWQFESTRHEWEIIRRSENERGGEAFAPWTCVNNCTGEEAQTNGREQQHAAHEQPRGREKGPGDMERGADERESDRQQLGNPSAGGN